MKIIITCNYHSESTKIDYGCIFIYLVDFMYTEKNYSLNDIFFKVSSCNQFILATFK